MRGEIANSSAVQDTKPGKCELLAEMLTRLGSSEADVRDLFELLYDAATILAEGARPYGYQRAALGQA
jgi:hypothetical protein